MNYWVLPSPPPALPFALLAEHSTWPSFPAFLPHLPLCSLPVQDWRGLSSGCSVTGDAPLAFFKDPSEAGFPGEPGVWCGEAMSAAQAGQREADHEKPNRYRNSLSRLLKQFSKYLRQLLADRTSVEASSHEAVARLVEELFPRERNYFGTEIVRQLLSPSRDRVPIFGWLRREFIRFVETVFPRLIAQTQPTQRRVLAEQLKKGRQIIAYYGLQ